MTYYQRPIAAYSMSEFESVTGRTANFGRGKDKKKRKRRGAMIAGGIGAGLAGAGAGAAGLYALGTRGTSNTKRTSAGNVTTRELSPIARRMRSQRDAFGATVKELRGAKDSAARKAALKDLGTNIKGMATEAGRGIQVGAGKIRSGIKSGVSGAYKGAMEGYRSGMLGNLGRVSKDNPTGARSALGRMTSGLKGGAKGLWSSGKTGKGALIGAGLLGAGAVAGGGYAAYKAMKKRKNRD